MDPAPQALQKAKRNLEIADHMLEVTYPMAGDPRLLKAVLENVFLSFTNALGALLEHERRFKRIPPFQDTFESKWTVFNLSVARRYRIDRAYGQLMRELKELLELHRKSPMEFVRDGKFVICSGMYDMRALSVDEMKKYISQSRLFLALVEGIVAKNG